jgi:hypothetical protein
MRPCTPSARSRWRTSVVLPAPRSPCRVMKALASSRLRCQLLGPGGGVVLAAPGGWLRGRGCAGAFYNLAGMVVGNSQLGSSNSGVGARAGILPNRRGRAWISRLRQEPGLMQWLAQGFHGDMHYMEAHGLKRARPAELVPGTVSVITARMDYLPRDRDSARGRSPGGRLAGRGARSGCSARPKASSRCTHRGRDYHKVLRARLQKLCDSHGRRGAGPGHRAAWPPRVHRFGPGAGGRAGPARSGQGWRGKHTLVLNREAGSTYFFLGEIYVDMPLPAVRARDGPLRQLRARASTCLPHAGHPGARTGWMRGAAFLT